MSNGCVKKWLGATVVGAAGMTGLACGPLGDFLSPGLWGGAIEANGVVRLGQSDSEIIHSLSQEHGFSDGARLKGLSSTELAAALRNAKLVAIDASKVNADELSDHPVVASALEQGVPVLIDNMSDAHALMRVSGLALSPDEETVQKLAQSGVAKHHRHLSVLIEPVNGSRELLLTVFGPVHNRLAEKHVPVDDEREEGPAEDEATGEDELADDDEGQPLTHDDPEVHHHHGLHDAVRLMRIRSRLAEVNTVPAMMKDAIRSQTSGNLADLGKAVKTWWVASSEANAWSPDGKQQAYLDVQFRVDLFASQVPFNRFLRVTVVGTGTNPGSAEYASGRQRGWYQDQVVIEFGPYGSNGYGDANLNIYSHGPQNANNVHTVTTSQGFSIGVSADANGPGGTASYNESQSISTQITDFSVVNNTNPVRGNWDYRMASISGKSYNFSSPAASIPYRSKCHMETNVPPTLARNTFQPIAQAIWRADGDYTGTVNFRFMTSQRLTFVDIYSSKCKFIHTVSWKARANMSTKTQIMNLLVDFSAVQPSIN